MALDTSMYGKLNPVDLFGSFQRGMEMKNAMEQRDLAKQERERQAKIDQAYQAGVIQNPDGTYSIDQNKTLQALAGIQGGGKTAYDFNQTSTQQRIAEEQRANDRKQQEFENQIKQKTLDSNMQKSQWDREQQLVNMGKTRAETSELLRKPTVAPEIKQNQATAAGFGRRLEQAEGVFDDLSSSGYDRGGFVESISSALPSFAQGSKSQQQEQAERNYINAVLRRESGAAISPTEFESAEKQYFPRFGDSPEVVAQKKANREQARIALQAEAGKAWDKIPLAQRPTDFISPVRVIAPDGTIRTIPKNQLKSALASGGKLAE